MLDRLGNAVRFDVGLFHAFTPRVPLETGAIVGIAAERVAATLPDWDALAVELGALREYANRHGIATDRDVFREPGPARRRFTERALRPFGMRRMAMMHLSVRDEVRSGIALFSKREDAFNPSEVEFLLAILPALAISDALLTHETNTLSPKVPTRLVCLDGRLTRRQQQIMEHVALGHTNEEIAEALSLARATVRNHLAVIFTRLHASNRAEAVRLAVLTPS
jgi:DNA-binding CsgD family transcriptional regulator